MSIQLLNEQVIAQIAAGEVVERPASVVKELLENALDAGAGNIHIEIKGGGRQLIRISDDGEGILAEEVPLAVARHATSKLQATDDLYRIRTLGFRGEALASIAAVSHFTIATRQRDEEIGTEIRLSGGKITRQRSIGAPAGTSVSVENLFYNVPARLKFLKSENSEKRHITNIVTHYAMAYPGVRFVLVQDRREIFRSPGSGQLGDVVVKVIGLKDFKQMLEVEDEQPIRGRAGSVRIRGFVSMPDLNRKDRTRIILFVNGRAIQDTKLTYAVTQAYHALLAKGRYPVAVLMIDVPPEFVDVNVHPTKAEVRFQDQEAVFAALQRVVREAVIHHAEPRLRRSSTAARGPARSEGGWASLRDADVSSAPEDGQRGFGWTPDEPATLSTAEVFEREDLEAIPEGKGRPEKPRTLPVLRVVGQVGAAYIVAEGPAGMYLVDQHAAHQRILYQQMMEERDQAGTVQRREIDTWTLDVTPEEQRLVGTHSDSLQTWGIIVDNFGPNTCAIRAVPQQLRITDPAALLADILRSWQRSQLRGDDISPEDSVLYCLCQHGAVKSGQILQREEMQSLIRALERCPDPLTSPTGKPTMLHMSASQLAESFERG